MRRILNLTVEYDFVTDRVTAQCRRNDGVLLQSTALLPRMGMTASAPDLARDIARTVIERCARDVLREVLKDV